jgi:hypothetical protein
MKSQPEALARILAPLDQRRADPVPDLTTRSMIVRANSADDKTRSVEAVFTTETPVLVRDQRSYDLIDEVLRMDGAEIPDRISMLNNHFRYSLDDVLGSGREMRVENGQLLGRLYFADDDASERAWKKTRAGHLPDVSVGYRVVDGVDIAAGTTATVNGRSYTAGKRTLRVVTKWQPREISLVPVGADPKAKVREEPHTLAPPPSPPSSARTHVMPKSLRDYLLSLGLRSDADDTAAWAFYNTLVGDNRTRADSLRGDVQPPAAPPVVPPAPPAAPSADGQRNAPPPAAPPAVPPTTPPTEFDRVRAEAAVAERTRIERLRALGGEDVPAELVQRAISEGWDEGRAAPQFLQAVRDGRSPAANAGPAIHTRGHEQDCTRSALQAGVMLRAGNAIDRDWRADARTSQIVTAGRLPTWMVADINNPVRQRAMDNAHLYSDMSLVDLCRECVRLDGHTVSANRDEMIRSAVSGGALTAIFSTNINAELLGAYAEAADSTMGWVDETEVPDFKASERAAMGKFGALTKHARGGEADHLDLSDSKESSKIARYSGQWVLDEMDIIDDRFGALEQMSPAEMGLAAAALRPDLVYAILLANAALDADSVALFHSSHANTNTLAFSATTLQTAIAEFAKQRIRNRPLNVRPRYVLVPHDLRFAGDIYLTSAQRFDGSSTGTAGGVKNPLAELGLILVADDRMGVNGVTDPVTGTVYAGSATNWYLSARPKENGAKTLVVKYRRGTGRAPQVRSFQRTQGKWGIGWDIAHDIGADADDFRGLYRGNV